MTTLDELKKKRPDLVEIIRAEERQKLHTIQEKIKDDLRLAKLQLAQIEGNNTIEDLKTQIATLKARKAALEGDLKAMDEAGKIKKQIKNSGLGHLITEEQIAGLNSQGIGAFLEQTKKFLNGFLKRDKNWSFSSVRPVLRPFGGYWFAKDVRGQGLSTSSYPKYQKNPRGWFTSSLWFSGISRPRLGISWQSLCVTSR